MVEARPELVPNGYNIKNVNCWNDQWTFTAAGVPSMYFRARTAEYGSKWYHTDYDAIGLMDYEYMAKINKFVFAIVKQFDRGLIPYDIAARAADLDDNVDGAALVAAGADDGRRRRARGEDRPVQASGPTPTRRAPPRSRRAARRSPTCGS